MHTLMSNQQYYQALGSSSIVNKEGLNSEYPQPHLAAIPSPCRAPRLANRGHLGKEAPPPASQCGASDTLAYCTSYLGKSLHLVL